MYKNEDSEEGPTNYTNSKPAQTKKASDPKVTAALSSINEIS